MEYVAVLNNYVKYSLDDKQMLCYILNLTDWNLDLIFFPAVFSSIPSFL